MRNDVRKTEEYSVICSDRTESVTIYRELNGVPEITTIGFRTNADYQRFLGDLDDAHVAEDEILGDQIVEKLLEKAKVEWKRGGR